jgi:hypothetical protein
MPLFRPFAKRPPKAAEVSQVHIRVRVLSSRETTMLASRPAVSAAISPKSRSNVRITRSSAPAFGSPPIPTAPKRLRHQPPARLPQLPNQQVHPIEE